MALVTLSEVKVALGETGTANDDRIAALLDPVSAAIESYARRAFSQASRTERHFGGTTSIALAKYPVASITSVTDMDGGAALDATGYELDATFGMLRRLPYGTEWRCGARGNPRWKVVYVGGPSVAPEDVKLAVYEWTASLLRSQGGLASESEGDYSYTVADATSGMPASVKVLLDRYRQAPI